MLGGPLQRQMCDGIVGKTEKWSGACVMERGRTGDVVAATDEKEAEMDDMSSLPSRVGGMVYNSLELMQMQPQRQQHPPGCGQQQTL